MAKFKHRSTTDWDYNREPQIAGRIAEIGSVKVEGGDGGKKQREAGFVILETEAGNRRVWTGYQLDEAWKAAKAVKGDGVYICHLGEKSLKAGRRLTLFDVQVWEWDGAMPPEITKLMERPAAVADVGRVQTYAPPAQK